MYHVSAQGADERMINVHCYYCCWTVHSGFITSLPLLFCAGPMLVPDVPTNSTGFGLRDLRYASQF